MLEVLIKRHYREHELHGLRTFSEGGRPFAVADYTLADRPTHLTSTIGGVDELVPGSPLDAAVSNDLWPRAAGLHHVVDLYLRRPQEPESPHAASEQLASLLQQLP